MVGNPVNNSKNGNQPKNMERKGISKDFRQEAKTRTGITHNKIIMRHCKLISSFIYFLTDEAYLKSFSSACGTTVSVDTGP